MICEQNQQCLIRPRLIGGYDIQVVLKDLEVLGFQVRIFLKFVYNQERTPRQTANATF